MRTRQIICAICYILSCLLFLYTFGGKTILTDSERGRMRKNSIGLYRCLQIHSGVDTEYKKTTA